MTQSPKFAADRAKYIISNNKYFTLATVSEHKRPWTNVVFYAFDKKYNFYFVSNTDTFHSKNIAKNEYVAFTIYDSETPIGVYECVQFTGRVSVVGEGNEIGAGKEDAVSEAVVIYSARLAQYQTANPNPEHAPIDYSYSYPAKYRIYKIEVIKAYLTDSEGKTEVHLK